MKTIYLKKRIDCRFGVTLFPNKPYQATFKPELNRWNVQVSPVVYVGIRPKDVLTKA